MGDRGAAWGGWAVFAGMMVMILGFFNAIDGLVALFQDEFFVPTRAGLLVFDITAWGWIHLIVGIVMILAGGAIFGGALWGRVVGIIVAGLNAIAQMAFVSAFPVWSILIIGLDVVAIYALTVYGREAARRL